MNSTQKLLLKELLKKVDPSYVAFCQKASQNPNSLGVRAPILKQHLRAFIKSHPLDDLIAPLEKNAPFELLYAKAFAISKLPIGKRKFECILCFLKNLNGWAITDGFCSLLKDCKENQREYFKFIRPLFELKEEYSVRFAIVMSLMYFNEEAYLKKLLKIFELLKADAYYKTMAIAWAVATFYCKHPSIIFNYLKQSKLDDKTFNLCIDKILQSNRPTLEQKAQVKLLKRKKAKAINLS